VWRIQCPQCGEWHALKEYHPSLADECSCPTCDHFFMIDWDEFIKDDDDTEESEG
jgi:hypothetical protein